MFGTKNNVDYVAHARKDSNLDYMQRLERENDLLRRSLRPFWLFDPVVYKASIITFLFGGLVWNLVFMAILPPPIKDAYMAFENFKNEAVFNLRCDWRQSQKK